MVLYNTTLVNRLQNAINANNYSLTQYKSYNDIGDVYISEILIKLKQYSDHRETEIHINNYEINHTYIKLWKNNTPGLTFLRDYKNDTKDNNGNIPYYYIEFMLNNKPYLALIRNLFEVNNDVDLTDELKTFKSKHKDIIINGDSYALLKITPNKYGVTWAFKDDMKDINSDIYDRNHVEQTVTSDIDEEEEQEEPMEQMDPLF